jgi:nucleotide-binding universal stress UspA family protein
MRNLLVVMDHSLEASIALTMACRFESTVRIHPIYVTPSPGHDLEIGAGWARKSWGKENIQKARKDVQDLVISQGRQCPYLEDPIITGGDPVRTVATHFMESNYDMLITGAPYRSLDAMALAHRFKEAVRKSSKDLPLLIVRHLSTVKGTLALTDGGNQAIKTLGFLNRISPLLSEEITLIGLTRKDAAPSTTDALILERGLAILKEKNINAEGHTETGLGHEGLKKKIEKTGLLICPYLSAACMGWYEKLGKHLDSILFYMTNE